MMPCQLYWLSWVVRFENLASIDNEDDHTIIRLFSVAALDVHVVRYANVDQRYREYQLFTFV